MEIGSFTSTGVRGRNSNNRVIVIRNGAPPSLFSRELTRQEERFLENDKEELEELKDELLDVGDVFESAPTLANFRIFREMVGRFARKATAIAYRLDKKPGGRLAWPMEIVTIIDRAADELYHLVMQGQQGRVRIAGRMANIKGMIVQISA